MRMNLLGYIHSFWSSSIRRQLILGITMVHAVLMTIFVFDLVERQRGFLSKQSVKQTISLAETLSTNSVSWLLANDVVGMEEIIDSQSSYPGLEYAMVLTPEGRVLAHTNREFNGKYVTDDISNTLLTADISVQHMQSGLDLVEIAVPIMANDKHIGWARVAVSGGDISKGLGIITRDGIIYTLIAILVGLAFAIIMARNITSDLKKLVDVASSVSEGGTERVSIDRKDEIGALAKGFNRMLVSLGRNARAQSMLEQEIRSHRDRLEELISERTSELEHARDEALQATVAKSAFLASMSHELRTPLNSIIGFTGIVMDEEAGALNGEQKKQLGMVYNSSRHLLELINDILDLSKVESGKLEVNKESFEFQSLMTDIYDMMYPLAEAKGLKFGAKCLAHNQDSGDTYSDILFTDKGKLRQVLINLVGNAIKFTERGSVTLSCEEEDGTLRISVQDTGIGISENDLGYIFEAFQQIDFGDTRQQEGTGLGLAISKEFIEILGGTLSVESEIGKGSYFQITIPTGKRTTVQMTSNTYVRNDSDEKKLILVVDNQNDARELIKNYLERDGYDVLLSDTGEDVMHMARKHQPFAITLDIMMPEPDGWSTLASLKNDPDTADIPVVLISVLDEKNLGLSLGAVDYLQKPIDSKQLLKTLNNLQLSGNNILVVDDREQDAGLLAAMLEPGGYQTRYADSGAAAIAMVGDSVPDLILLDLMMPGMSGFEVIRRLRSSKGKICDVPIIVVSAKSLTEAEHEYLYQNVEQVLVKGQFDRGSMLKEVGSLLNRIGQDKKAV